jgi:hypothetical protein
MTSLLFENFADYSGTRDSRVLALARARADEGLAGRSVWSAAASRSSRLRTRALLACLPAARHGGPIELAPEEPLHQIGERLERMLAGVAAQRPEWDEVEELARAMQRGELIVGETVASGDVVVLDDPLGVVLAPAVRDRGAHAVLEIRPGSARRMASVSRAEPLLRRCAAAVDARVMTWRELGQSGARRIAALISSEDAVAAKEITARGAHPEEICWTTVLAEIVELDRSETVGGRMHARPTVAAR